MTVKLVCMSTFLQQIPVSIFTVADIHRLRFCMHALHYVTLQ